MADRSNHRVQCFRMSDGTAVDCTARDAVWGPYGLALHMARGSQLMLYVCDANNDRIVGFNARALSAAPLVAFGSNGALAGELDRPRGLSVAGSELVVAELGNNRCSVWSSHSGECTRTVGDVASENGALPLRQPFGVMHAHGLLLVTESTTFGRLVVFSWPAGEPLQVLSPRGCAALGGMVADAHWIYCLDAEKGHVLSFTAKPPAKLGTVRERRPLLQTASPRGKAKPPPPPPPPHSQGAPKGDGAGSGGTSACNGSDTAAATPSSAAASAAASVAASADPPSSASITAEDTLAAWVAAHADDPVPSYSEKRQLAARAGLPIKAVSEWFAARKAHKKASQVEQREAEAASAAAALEGLSLDAKRRAMAERLAESLGGYASGGPDMQFDAARFRNMSEY